jgi:hypothetical protein
MSPPSAPGTQSDSPVNPTSHGPGDFERTNLKASDVDSESRISRVLPAGLAAHPSGRTILPLRRPRRLCAGRRWDDYSNLRPLREPRRRRSAGVPCNVTDSSKFCATCRRGRMI